MSELETSASNQADSITSTPGQIAALYRGLLGREPENDDVVRKRLHLDPVTVALGIALSEEARSQLKPSPLWVFNSRIPVEQIVRSHEAVGRQPTPGRLVNYLGVKIDPIFLPSLLTGRAGQVEEVPIPANWHADMAEWAAALRAVDLATKTFRVVELGCGWGCWLLNTGVAARNRGLDVQLLGAEGDAGHVAFAERACAENGFTSDQFRIERAIVGPNSGTALFPRQEHAGENWGLEPIFTADEAEIEKATSSGQYDQLPTITLQQLTDRKRVDLLHIDIQGGEADFIESCVYDLKRFVRYLVVGTHSRQIEGRVMACLLDLGWTLEIERPAILGLSGDKPLVLIDGVQGWLNPEL